MRISNWDNSGPANWDPKQKAPIDPFNTARFNVQPVDQALSGPAYQQNRSLKQAAVPVLVLLAFMWGIYIFESVTRIDLTALLGIHAGRMSSLWNIFTYSFEHLNFLITAAIVEKNSSQRAGRIGVAVAVGIFYGSSMLFSLIPRADVSWQGHLLGAVGGVLAAIIIEGNEARQLKAAQNQPQIFPPRH